MTGVLINIEYGRDLELLEKFLNLLSEHYEAIIASCALLLTVYEIHLSRQNNELSVRPHLIIFPYRKTNGGEGELKVEIMNNGLGPALIKNFQVLFDHKLVCDGDFRKANIFFENLLANETLLHKHLTILGKNYAFAANHNITLIELKFPLASLEQMDVLGSRPINDGRFPGFP